MNKAKQTTHVFQRRDVVGNKPRCKSGVGNAKLPKTRVTLKVIKPTGLSFLLKWLDFVQPTNKPQPSPQYENALFPSVLDCKDAALMPEDPEVRKMVEDAIKPKPTTVRIGVIGGTEDFEHTAKISLRSPYESC